MGAAELEKVPDREIYATGAQGSVAWFEDTVGFADNNFDDGGNEVIWRRRVGRRNEKNRARGRTARQEPPP